MIIFLTTKADKLDMVNLILFSETAGDLAAAFPDAKRIEERVFPDGESYVRLPANCGGKDVIILHRCYPSPNENLVKLFLIVDAVRAHSPSSLRVFIPYLPYARMDKAVKEWEAVSADTICRMLKGLGCTELITIDCHFIKQGAGLFERAGLKIRNISAADALLDYLKGIALNPIVTSPDEGAAYMSSRTEGGKAMKKIRGEYGEGKSAYRQIDRLEAGFDVKERDVIIIDDMVSTGSTMVKAVSVLKSAGARKVFCAATHGLFLNNALEKLFASGADEVVTTDSIKSPAAKIHITELLRGVIL